MCIPAHAVKSIFAHLSADQNGGAAELAHGAGRRVKGYRSIFGRLLGRNRIIVAPFLKREPLGCGVLGGSAAKVPKRRRLPSEDA
jgi:hypothetical protein